ncbi:MAG: hypothetical protein HY785_18155 [Oscillatoriophycideae cyanobacterium NC_groundwater_1537_Pr4_S-0.65um_50_18]|nr:hypothetical protein [Oscillatoriophycideae cyanobacterium NC_groundwater_1537_Pr4_S-0.65um_50_18]
MGMLKLSLVIPVNRVIRGVLASLLATTLMTAAGSAHAETQELNYTIDSSENRSYATVMEQAEAIAANLITQALTSNSNITEVSVKVTGDRNGSLSPLLFVKVSRSDWQNQPNVQIWAQYFSDASVLLGYRSGSQASAIASNPSYAPTIPSGSVNPNSEPNFYN